MTVPRVRQRLLVIPDGLAEATGTVPTTLEATTTLALDALARRAAVRRVATTPDGLHAGSETGLPLLLGWRPTGAVSRGRIEAAAHGIELPAGATVHRVDVRHADGRPWPELTASGQRLLAVSTAEQAVHPLGGHRLLVIRDPTAGALVPPRGLDLDDLGAADGVAGTHDPDDQPSFHVWPDGTQPPALLDASTVVVCAPRSTAAGVARLLGAAVVHPPGATGRPGTAVPAKAQAAIELLRAGTATVVVHVGSPDEAAHAHDPQAKQRELLKIDRDLLAPLAGLAMDLGAILAVCPDHGTDPRSGRHVGEPVPSLLWGPGVPASGPQRMTETATAGGLTVLDPWAGA